MADQRQNKGERKQGGDTDILGDEDRPKSQQLRDELRPEKGEPVEQPKTGGDQPDSAGQHGRMAPETAKALDEEQS